MHHSIERLHAGDAGECFDVMTKAFQASRPGHPHFRDILPIMCRDDEEHMNKHLAIRENGAICAVLGVYPLPVQIGAVTLLGSTVGNVGTLPEARGKGYMTALLDGAMEELERLDADLSRLGGRRQRYNRYGYERAGFQYSFHLPLENAEAASREPITFRPIGLADTELLDIARRLYEKEPMHVLRQNREDFYLTMVAWQNIPYAAFQADGRMIGYLCGAATGGEVAEAAAENPDWLVQLLAAWGKERQAAVHFSLRPWQWAEMARLQVVCDSYSLSSPCQFLIRRWDRVTDALMKLRHSLSPMAEGTWILGIEGWGNLRLFVSQGEAGAQRTTERAAFTTDRLTATRLLFGPLPPWGTIDANLGIAASWLPLPLGWNLQDRV